MEDLLLDQSIAKDDYDKKLKELKENQYDINLQIEDHTKADENYYKTASDVLDIAKRAKQIFEKITFKRIITIAIYYLSSELFFVVF